MPLPVIAGLLTFSFFFDKNQRFSVVNFLDFFLTLNASHSSSSIPYVLKQTCHDTSIIGSNSPPLSSINDRRSS